MSSMSCPPTRRSDRKLDALSLCIPDLMEAFSQSISWALTEFLMAGVFQLNDAEHPKDLGVQQEQD